MQDNIQAMKEFQPFSDEEFAAVKRVCEIFREQDMIPCTSCRYCTDGCPKNISIPDLFACMNAKKQYQDWNSDYYYREVHTARRYEYGDWGESILSRKTADFCVIVWSFACLYANAVEIWRSNEETDCVAYK